MQDDAEYENKPTAKQGPFLSKEVEMMEGNPEELAEKLKNEGNDAVKANNFSLAVTKYGQSLGNIDFLQLVIQNWSRQRPLLLTGLLHISN